MTEETLPQMTKSQIILETNTEKALDFDGVTEVVPYHIAKMLVDDLEGLITVLKAFVLECPECVRTMEALNRKLEDRIKQMTTGRTPPSYTP